MKANINYKLQGNKKEKQFINYFHLERVSKMRIKELLVS